MREVLSGLDLDVRDQVPLLEDAYEREGRALAMELGHWSPRGNCVIADDLARHLARDNHRFSLRGGAPDCPRGDALAHGPPGRSDRQGESHRLE